MSIRCIKLRSPTARRQPERVVVEHLRLRAPSGVFWMHYPAGGRRHPTEAAILKEMGTRAGVPDLLFVIDGRLYGLELKADYHGRLSPEQIATHEAMRRAGAVVGTAAGIDQALAILGEWGIIGGRR
jgi:hypothetical protein